MNNFKWIKKGLLFNPKNHQTPEWMDTFAQAPSVLIFDNFIRVYFACRPKPDSNGQYISRLGFVDLDRKDLFKILNISATPIMELGNFGAFDEFGTYPVSVIKYDNQIRAYYAGWTRCVSVPYNTSIGYATSDNGGITFKKYGEGPILSFSPNEPMTISGPKIRRFNDEWIMFYVAGIKWIHGVSKPESVFKIRMAKSKDGIEWKKLDKTVIADRLEENECQASPDVIFKNGKYHMFFSYKYSYDFRNKDRGYRIGYASSIDLINWERDDSKSGIDVSEEGWDSEMISYSHVFELDGKTYMMYLGNQVGKEGFGLAVLEGELK
jgi:sucrose-6-phosphate hydrolase SacC (GH32 family)